MRRRAFIATTGALLAAASYPSIALREAATRIVHPGTPGSAPDFTAKLLANEWQRETGKPFFAESKPGASGNIAAEYVARARADGLTLLIGTSGTHGINKAIFPKLSYDPVDDFAPISLLTTSANVLIVSKHSKIRTLADLVTTAKAVPGKLTYGTPGMGTSLHMTAELFARCADIHITHVPYRGRAQFLPDLMGGHIHMVFDNLPSAIELIRSGDVVPLAISTKVRSSQAGWIPTFIESGFKEVEVVPWSGLFAPRATPLETIIRYNNLVHTTFASPAVMEIYRVQGSTIAVGSPRELELRVANELKRWAELVPQLSLDRQP